MIDGDSRNATAGEPEGWDFFISYTTADQSWAEWIAWQLEGAGYRVLIQAWAFPRGTSFKIRMKQGVVRARRTVAVLSVAYLSSVYGTSEWQAAHAADPDGFERKLLPVRIEDCRLPGFLDPVVSIDLFGRDSNEASRHLLHHVGHALIGRAKPTSAPDFPARRLPLPVAEPTFPADRQTPVGASAISNDRASNENVLAQQRRKLGSDHADTLLTAHNLADALRELKDYAAARDLYEGTLERRRRTLGPTTTASSPPPTG